MSKPDLIPLDVLLGNPERVQPSLSPDGKSIAYIAPLNDVLNVWVGPVGSEDYKPVTKDTDRGINGFTWTQDGKHILYPQDIGGDEDWHIYRTNLTTGETVDVTPFPKIAAQMIGGSKDFPDIMLIGLNKDNPALHDAYRLQISTGELTLIAKNPGNVMQWIADRELKIRGARCFNPDGSFDVIVRDSEDAEWRQILHYDSDESFSSGPAGFTKDGKFLYATIAGDANASRLIKLNVADGSFEVIAEDGTYDLGGAFVDNENYEAQAYAVTGARTEWHMLTDKYKADFEALRKLHSGDFGVTSRDRDDKTWLVAFTADDGPISYYSFDRASKKATFLFNHRSDLEKYELNKLEPVSFRARDGLTIHGYLSLPKGESKNLPLVLNVHGGPWSRDAWGFDPESQFFTNRGYATLKVNFRGSIGYGKDFINAGDKEWAGKMHDDLIDGVNFLVEKGIVDPKKVAIYGGSYGGYAALVGATFTPDFFACAIDLVGPSNLITLLENIPPYWVAIKATFEKRLGDPVKDAEFLKSRSPLFKVDQIKIPMLIGQGKNDPRVTEVESTQIVDAMKAKGIDHEYYLFEDEGHGFVKPENRLKFYGITEKFLAKHLGGRTA